MKQSFISTGRSITKLDVKKNHSSLLVWRVSQEHDWLKKVQIYGWVAYLSIWQLPSRDCSILPNRPNVTSILWSSIKNQIYPFIRMQINSFNCKDIFIWKSFSLCRIWGGFPSFVKLTGGWDMGSTLYIWNSGKNTIWMGSTTPIPHKVLVLLPKLNPTFHPHLILNKRKFIFQSQYFNLIPSRDVFAKVLNAP